MFPCVPLHFNQCYFMCNGFSFLFFVLLFTATSQFSTLSITATTVSAAAAGDDKPTDVTTVSHSSTAAVRPRCGGRKRVRSVKSSMTGPADDGELFNKWLASEIETNSVKIELMNAKKELVDLKKQKIKLEILALQAEPLMFDSEL